MERKSVQRFLQSSVKNNSDVNVGECRENYLTCRGEGQQVKGIFNYVTKTWTIQKMQRYVDDEINRE